MVPVSIYSNWREGRDTKGLLSEMMSSFVAMKLPIHGIIESVSSIIVICGTFGTLSPPLLSRADIVLRIETSLLCCANTVWYFDFIISSISEIIPKYLVHSEFQQHL